jgi:hypothetical protein
MKRKIEELVSKINGHSTDYVGPSAVRAEWSLAWIDAQCPDSQLWGNAAVGGSVSGLRAFIAGESSALFTRPRQRLASAWR